MVGATSASYQVPRAEGNHAGIYVLQAINSLGTVSSNAVTVTVILPKLTNLSVRSTAGSGDQTLIVGFVIGGVGQKQALIRGIGPTLGSLGVVGAMANSQLRLYNAGGVMINDNDDWGGSAALVGTFSRVGAFPLTTTSKDAALHTILPSGGYTAQLSASAGSGNGVALVEFYDADVAGTLPTGNLVNLSAGNMVGTGDNILIAGFVLAGYAPKSILVRGIGPSLAQFGVNGVLQNPKLQLYNGSTLLAENDNWGGTASVAAAFTQVGAFGLASNSLDAALVISVQPGTYTAQVSGVLNTTGVALLEVYDMP